MRSLPAFLTSILSEPLARTERREPDEYIFQSHAGGPVRYTKFRVRVFNPATKKARLDGVTFHALRHSAGGLLRQAGVRTQINQQRLGHACSRTTTDIYGWVPDESEKAAATSLNDIFTTRGLSAACGEVGEASA